MRSIFHRHWPVSNMVASIWPRTRFWDWVRILSDPDPQELERLALQVKLEALQLKFDLGRMIRVGQLVTWPKVPSSANVSSFR
jgi:hypothetical protein